MSAVSLSVRVDAGVIGHNNRDFIAKNVNKDKVADNITYVKKDLKEVYQETFGKALEEYNAKQKRSDRVIKDYYEHIKNSNQEKLFYEAVIQFGNIDNSAVGTEGGEVAKKMLDDYMKSFEKRNPNLIVFNAVMHLDEATPHLHISFVPVAHNQNRGLATRVSLKKAMEEMDVTAKTKKLTERQQWAESEKKIMKEIAKKYGLGIERKNISRPHMLVDEYKSAQDNLKATQKKITELYKKSNIEPSVKKTEEKIKSTSGMEREFYIGVQRTVTIIFSGNKIPKKYNPAKSYSINNDWHINELATQINFINREHINSAAELENLIEKSGANILEQQNSLNEITEMQSSMRDVISKAEFYFANNDKRGDAMFTAKLAAAKETLDKFNITRLEDLEPLKIQYGENIKALSKINASMSELQKKQSTLLKLQEAHQALTNGNYIDNLTEKQKAKKEQDLK